MRSSPEVGIKPKRPPTITPKRFTRFFTPRLHESATKRRSKSARQLQDITKNAVNRQSAVLDSTPPRNKRRKLSPALESSPLQSSPSKRATIDSSPIQIHTGRDDVFELSDNDEQSELCNGLQALQSPIRRPKGGNSISTRLLQRSFGGSKAIGRGRVRDVCLDWQDSTSKFYSQPEDRHNFQSGPLPFCATACHSNSMVAIGDEEGGIRLVDSAGIKGAEFGRTHVSFRPHQNAVMDLSFSSDDYLFATASGDQTARVIDMRTQQTRYIMAGHCSSVKQVRFQPGNDSILATSSRDGSVQIWDLRCRGSNSPVQGLQVAMEAGLESAAHRQVVYANTCISIRDAHVNTGGARSGSGLFESKADSSRRMDVSITALSFLPQREHLFLTASEANASVKLWDIRGRYHRGSATPVSSTAEPESHMKHRRFGLSSMAFNTDGSRLYTLCKDSTVYVHSTNHLILGQAPELSAGKWRRSNEGQTGLGPMYAFRHPKLKTSTFYIKAGVRAQKNGKEEMLAVGSRDGCAILFPTDESYFRKNARAQRAMEDDGLEGLPVRPTMQRSAGKMGSMDTIPIYENGAALVRGHQSEVTGLTWTHDGNLVTIGDDFSARCWREGPQARELRMAGEGEGKRWNSGWAEVMDGYDDDE